jgi:hypothetical protein
MINLTKGIDGYSVLTLTEKQLIAAPNYLFIFTGRTSNKVTALLRLNNTDISLYKERYNKILIPHSTFANLKDTQFLYQVYEQTGTGTNPTGLNLLENGLMVISEAVVIFTNPTSTTEFILP